MEELLGLVATDVVTGLGGVVTGIHHTLYGATQIHIEVFNEGKIETYWFPENRINFHQPKNNQEKTKTL